MIITTEHGTKFEIDTENKTWKRIDKTGDSGNLRSEEGSYINIWDFAVGTSLTLLCPPFIENGPSRLIQTSKIAEIE